MSLNARSIALQGVGFGPRHVALQGLVPLVGFLPGGRRVRLPRALVAAHRLGAIDEDDSLLLIAAVIWVGGV